MGKKELSWAACWKVDELKRVKVKGYEKREVRLGVRGREGWRWFGLRDWSGGLDGASFGRKSALACMYL